MAKQYNLLFYKTGNCPMQHLMKILFTRKTCGIILWWEIVFPELRYCIKLLRYFRNINFISWLSGWPLILVCEVSFCLLQYPYKECSWKSNQNRQALRPLKLTLTLSQINSSYTLKKELIQLTEEIIKKKLSIHRKITIKPICSGLNCDLKHNHINKVR